MVARLPELSDWPEDEVNDLRTRVLGTLALWIEILRDVEDKSAELDQHLTSWLKSLIEDPHLNLVPSEEEVEDDDDDDKAIVKEFMELLDDLKQPSKKKQKV